MLLSTLLATFAISAPVQDERLLSESEMSQFVTVANDHFTLAGRPFYFAGTNCYYLFYAQRTDIDQFFASAVKAGSTVVRTWLYADGNNDRSPSADNQKIWFQEFNPKTQQVEYNGDYTSGLGRFDYVLDSASRHGIKLIVALTNNWADFGGIDWYNAKLGPGSNFHSDFYHDEKLMNYFKRYIDFALNHVSHISNVAIKNDPTIMAIELGNELRCVGSQQNGVGNTDPKCNTEMLTKWIDSMSKYVKSVDHNHLVTIGDEGFWNTNDKSLQISGAYSNLWDGSSGLDFAANARLEAIDYLGIHTYMDAWGTGQDPQFVQNSVKWIEDHGKLSQKIRKPIVIAEYGIRNNGQNMRVNDFPMIQKAAESAGFSGTLIWMIGGPWYGQPSYPDYDGYTLSFSDPNIQTIFLDHSSRMNAKNRQV